MAWEYQILGEASDNMELQICDAIGDANKGVTSSAVRDAFKANKNAKSIVCNIHSAGGEVLDGLAIYNLLASHPAHVTVRIPTLAASIASIIAMAGDSIEIGKGAFMMVHNPYAQTKGGSEDLRKLADVLDKMRDSMVAIYSKRTGKPKEDVLELMEAETWMTGPEAVKHGFADKLVDGPKKAIAADSLKIYAKVPDEILEQLTKPETENEAPASAQSQAGEDRMDEKLTKALEAMFDAFEKKIDAKYGKAAKATESSESKEKKNPFAEESAEESDDSSSDMPAEGKSKAKAEAQILNALVEANKMVAQLNAKLAAQHKTAFEARVTEAVAKGKLLPSQKAWALSLDEESFDSYLAAVGDQVFPVGKEHKENTEAAKEHAEKNAPVAELTKEERILAQQMGHSEADVIAYNKAHPKA